MKKLACASNQCLATVPAAQALFHAKQMIPFARGLGVSTVLSKRCSVCDCMHIHQLAFKTWKIKSNANELQFAKVFWLNFLQSLFTKLLPPKFFTRQ